MLHKKKIPGPIIQDVSTCYRKFSAGATSAFNDNLHRTLPVIFPWSKYVWLSPARKIKAESLQKQRTYLRGVTHRIGDVMVEITQGKLFVSHNLLQQYEMCISVRQSDHVQLLYGVWTVALLITMFKKGQNFQLIHMTVIPLFISERPNAGWQLTLQTGIRLQMKEEASLCTFNRNDLKNKTEQFCKIK